jgi:hypothetical protein
MHERRHQVRDGYSGSAASAAVKVPVGKDELQRALDLLLAGSDIPERLAALVDQEALAANRVLDWIGVAAGMPLSQRVKWLAVEVGTRQGYSLEEAERLADAAIGGESI